jgi:type IV pilus assembly protein PilC
MEGIEMIGDMVVYQLLAQADFEGSLSHDVVSSGSVAAYSLMLAALTVLELIPACGIIYVFYFFLTLPMRRNERTRLFLDLVELGLKEGRAPEKAIIDASSSRDPAPGARFHLLAAHLETGMKFSDALGKVPRLLPPQIIAMLKAGERIGDIAKVLPACRKLLGDGVSQVRGALNYLLVLVFVITPFTVFVPIMIGVMIIPKFKEVFIGMGTGQPLPAFTQFVFENSKTIVLFQFGFIALIWLLLLAYVGGPRFGELIRRVLPGVPDRILFRLPWRRKRLQRDFSAMLCVLLDAEVPEAEAVALAAESTANNLIRRRAEKVCEQLNRGVKLSEAIRAVDDCGELRWRISNALQRGGGFMRALAGWHESLDAKAFQLEQTAAQITTSALVIFNGFIVAGVVIGIFLALISLINGAALW